MVWVYYTLTQRIMSVKADAMAFRVRTLHLGCLLSLKWDGRVTDQGIKAKAKELVTEHRVFCEELIKAHAGYLQRPEADKDIPYEIYGKSTNRKGLPPLT